MSADIETRDRPPSIAVQAESPQGKARAKQVYDFQRAMARMTVAVHSGLRKSHLVLAVVCLAEGAALYHLAPLVRVQVMLLPVESSNGTFNPPFQAEPSLTLADLRNSPTAIAAALWNYVRLRESYSWAEAKDAWDIVSAMSATSVRTTFQQWYDFSNKASPQATYGYKDAIKLSWAESTLDGERYSVTFWRQLYTDGAPAGPPQEWTCKLTYSTTFQVPLVDRLRFNPGGLVVTTYPGCFPKGATPGGLVLGTGAPK